MHDVSCISSCLALITKMMSQHMFNANCHEIKVNCDSVIKCLSCLSKMRSGWLQRPQKMTCIALILKPFSNPSCHPGRHHSHHGMKVTTLYWFDETKGTSGPNPPPKKGPPDALIVGRFTAFIFIQVLFQKQKQNAIEKCTFSWKTDKFYCSMGCRQVNSKLI